MGGDGEGLHDLSAQVRWAGPPGQADAGLVHDGPLGAHDIVNADQLRFFADSMEPYGRETRVLDISTRQNIQL